MTPDEFDDLARRLKLRPSTLKKAKLSTQSTPDEVRAYLQARLENIDERMAALIGWATAADFELERLEQPTPCGVPIYQHNDDGCPFCTKGESETNE